MFGVTIFVLCASVGASILYEIKQEAKRKRDDERTLCAAVLGGDFSRAQMLPAISGSNDRYNHKHRDTKSLSLQIQIII